MDVRSTIRTNHDAIIYMTFAGRFLAGELIEKRLSDGEIISPRENHSMITPTFETGAAGKLDSLKEEPESHVRFDIFSLG